MLKGSFVAGCILAALATPVAAEEKRETIAGWTLEERRNPDEPRDYSVVVSRRLGAAELVASRSTVRGRRASMILADCSEIAFGNDMSSLSLAEQVQSIRDNVVSSYADSRKECRLPPLDPALLARLDEAWRAADARYRANRPAPPSLDRTQAVGGWTVEDRRDESSGEPGERLVSMTKTVGGLELRQTLKVDLFFDSMTFTDNLLSARYSDCRREHDLGRLENAGSPAETAAQRAAIVASLKELQADCQLPAATVTELLSDFAPAHRTIGEWARKHLADRAALEDAASAYENRLLDERAPQPVAGEGVEGAAEAGTAEMNAS